MCVYIFIYMCLCGYMYVYMYVYKFIKCVYVGVCAGDADGTCPLLPKRRSKDEQEDNTPKGRTWTSKWANTPLPHDAASTLAHTAPPESTTPPQTGATRIHMSPDTHTQTVTHTQNVTLPPGQTSGASDAESSTIRSSTEPARLESHLLVGVGESVTTVKWKARKLALEGSEDTIYIHVPIADENGHVMVGKFETHVLCEIDYTCSISRVPDDLGSANRCPALCLRWGPPADRLTMFIAGHDSREVVKWLIQVANIIEMLVLPSSVLALIVLT